MRAQMSQLIHLIHTYGIMIVFGIVLLEQIGLPIPAIPVLIVAGAHAASGEISCAACLAASVAACLISDYFWFKAGRFYGKRVLLLLCKISLSPEYCVSQTEDKFRRWGAKSLVVAKFVPGFSTVAPPLAGAMDTPKPVFVGYSLAGSIVWSATGLGAGIVFKDGIADLLTTLDDLGAIALIGTAVTLGAFVLYKFLERRRFRRSLTGDRIRMDELARLLDGEDQPIIIDARSFNGQQLERAIPGALIFKTCEPGKLMASLNKQLHIVVYCTCPNDVTAAKLARQFVANGFHLARALHGGLHAWNLHQQRSIEQGAPLSTISADTIPPDLLE